MSLNIATLQMVDGMVQFRFDCGSGEGQVRVDSILINDDNWHMLVLERHGTRAEITIDSMYKADSSTPGTNDVLNLDSNDVYFGAEVESMSHGYMAIRQGFKGCMKEIKVGNVALPYSGSNTISTFQRFEEIEFTCKRPYVAGTEYAFYFDIICK